MRKLIKDFLSDTEGAVMADYVVLTATLVSMSVSGVNAVRNGVGSLGDSINASLSQASVALLCAAEAGSTVAGCAAATSDTGGTDGTVDTGGTDGTVDTGGTDGTVDTGGTDGTDDTKFELVYDLQIVSAEEARQYQNQLRLSSADEISGLIRQVSDELYMAISTSEQEKALTLLDQYNLTLEVLSERPEYADALADYLADLQRAEEYMQGQTFDGREQPPLSEDPIFVEEPMVVEDEIAYYEAAVVEPPAQ